MKNQREMEAKELASGSVENQGAGETPVAVACVAGRELDAAIALLMGYRWCVWPPYPEEGRFLDLHWDKERAGVTPALATGREPLHRHALNAVSAYSTDITAAMQVVEHLRKLGFGFVMSDNVDHAPLWNVDVVGELKIEGEAHAESLPLAICCAVLKAMEQHSTDTDALRG